MLLAARGETISSSLIEPLTGVGLGAFWSERAGLLFFSSLAGAPDVGISQALQLLGFNFTEKSADDTSPVPWQSLQDDLAKSPAILGPVDMGFLHYNPSCGHVKGADHFILAYGMGENEVYLHDPDGFPHVSLSFTALEQAWKAEAIGYRRGSYRYWTAVQRREQPTPDEIFAQAVSAFKTAYRQSAEIAANAGLACDDAAIHMCAERVRRGKVAPPLKGHLKFFALKLGARRALDFAAFFDTRLPDLAALKHQQAEAFGQCHTLAVAERWSALSNALQTLAELEKQFRDRLLESPVG
jgi:hypothetical protein